MKITENQVAYVAHLARLDLDRDEDADQNLLEKFAGQIENILGYMDILNQVDTKDVLPTTHAIQMTNAFREDMPAAHLDRDLSLQNAPEQDDGCFIVPKIIG